MTFEQTLQLVGVVVGTLASAIGAAASARWGAKRLEAKTDLDKEVILKKIEHDNAAVLAKLERDYVTLESHRASMTSIHADKNKLAEEVAYLKGERAAQKVLDEKQNAEIDFLKAAFLAARVEPPKV